LGWVPAGVGSGGLEVLGAAAREAVGCVRANWVGGARVGARHHNEWECSGESGVRGMWAP